MALQDLRAWIALLEAKGELKRIKVEVDWDEEIGAVAREVASRRGPALLFENIKGYTDTPCHQLLTASLGTRRRVRLALGIPDEMNDTEAVLHLRKQFRSPREPEVTEAGPVKENIVQGDAVDLYKLPVPKWNPGDGGRYIFTMCSLVTRDPATGQINVGTYRGMVLDKNRIAVLLTRSQDWGKHFTSWEARGQEMPVAAVIGWDPVLFMCSGTPLPGDEYGVCGAIRGEPVSLVRCQTSDLMVPAAAEIVIEGRISPDPATFVSEGPFVEYPGYYGDVEARPVMRVECLTYRNNPTFAGLIAGASPGRYPSDGHWLRYFWPAVIWNGLEDAGITGITDISFDGWPEILKVQIHKSYQAHAQHLACALWGLKFANNGGKLLIVVDDDIDIRDRSAIDWALCYRVNPAMGAIAFFDTLGCALDPSIPVEQKNIAKYGQAMWRRTLIDATINWALEPRPEYGGRRYPPVGTEPSPRMQATVKRRWQEYGF